MNATETDRPPLVRTFVGGVLMGLANLVPGISGGTMILAIGLYDRFVGAVADLSRLRLRWESILFVAVVGAGLVAAVGTLSGVAVELVNDHRWVMYSLFVGLTLGGVPELLRRSRPVSAGVLAGIGFGLALMVLLATELQGAQLPDSLPVLLVVGAAAASSMILPGISGSYVLLILGMYDLVIGSLSVTAWREDAAASARIILPIILGAGIGIALLSNLLKVVLARAPRVSHGVLLGLLLGSVVGLWPFQHPVEPELAHKPTRKAVAMVLSGSDFEAIREKHGAEFDDPRLEELGGRYEGTESAELKRRGEALERFAPTPVQIASALGLLGIGFVTTLLMGSRDRGSEPA